VGIFDKNGVFDTYHARLEFREKVMGGIPKNPEIIEGWLRSKAGIEDELEVRQAMLRTLRELDPDADFNADASFEDLVKASKRLAGSMQTNGFKLDENGLYIESRQLKAGLKENVNILFAGQRWGKTRKGPKSFTAERTFVNPDRLYLGVKEPDGIDLVIGHVTDKQGQRSTVTYYEYVMRPVLEFEVIAARQNIGVKEGEIDAIPHEDWARVWTLYEENGIGALRSQGHGRFDITMWDRK